MPNENIIVDMDFENLYPHIQTYIVEADEIYRLKQIIKKQRLIKERKEKLEKLNKNEKNY